MLLQVSEDGLYLFSMCESSVKIIELSNMKTVHTFEEVDCMCNDIHVCMYGMYVCMYIVYVIGCRCG